MRYALRNIEKIRSYFEPYGDEIIDRILKSLEDYFATTTGIEKDIVQDVRPVLSINDLGHSFGLIEFYIIKKTYAVYILAFKRFVN